MQLTPTQREVRVGNYRTSSARTRVDAPSSLRTSLNPTDHSHLGQVLVYASGLEAAVVIWLTPSFRDEHRRVLDWLNERTDDTVDFFGVELDVERIGESSPAPVFRIVAQPNDWQKAVKSQTGRSRSNANGIRGPLGRFW